MSDRRLLAYHRALDASRARQQEAPEATSTGLSVWADTLLQFAVWFLLGGMVLWPALL
jgi:hypothetical protein